MILLKQETYVDEYELPLGELETYHSWNFTVTRWVPNSKRMKRLQKRVQGPLQKKIYKRAHDHTGKWIYPFNFKKHVLLKFRNSTRKMITIYDTDERCHVDRVYDNYNVNNDLRMMLNTIEIVKRTKKRSVDEFIEDLYEFDGISKYQKVDTIY